MVEQPKIHRKSRSEKVEERKEAAEQFGEYFAILEDKQQAWDDLHKLTSDNDSYVRWRTAVAIGIVFTHVLDKKQAWFDLHRLTLDAYSHVRWRAVDSIGTVFTHVPDKKQACDDLHRLTKDDNSYVRRGAAVALGAAFPHFYDKKQAWDDLHRLIKDEDSGVRWRGANAAVIAFPHIPNKEQAWDDLIELTQDAYSYVQWRAADAVVAVIPQVPDKKQAWSDLIRLLKNVGLDSYIRLRLSDSLVAAFPQVLDKKQACDDLYRLMKDNDRYVRLVSAKVFIATFPYILDKKHAWNNLHIIVKDGDSGVRRGVAVALGAAFPYVPDKKQAWDDLYRLIEDMDSGVRASAYHSLGKASIFMAANVKTYDDLKKEMERAIRYFENSSRQETYSKPAKFCLPFYRSFYTLTFKKEEAETEVHKYIAEAKSAVEGSESKEKLLEAVENLVNALKEVQKTRDLDDVKCDLNAYRRYCERAADMLDAAEEKAPGATQLVRKGLPIIDEWIKGIIAEIQEKAKLACKESKGTPSEEITCTANQQIQKWRVDDQEEMTWAVENLIFTLSSKIPHIPENKHIHDRIEIIRTEGDMIKQYIMIANLIALIPSVSIHTFVGNSTIGQVGNGHVDINPDKDQH